MSRSVLKALDIIEALARSENGLSLSDLSERAGFPLSTSHRLLNTLIGRGYVEQDPQTRRYCLGSGILTLQAQVVRQRQLVRLAFPHLDELKQQVQATVNLGVLSGKDVVYLETFVPDASLGFYSPPGTRMPSCCTAMGKLLLAHLYPQAVEELLSSLRLEPRTPNTITSLPDLRAELTRIAARGYAVDDQEYALGVRCVAAPIRDYSGNVIAAVSVTMPAEQLPIGCTDATAALVVAACRRISRALGHRDNA